MSTIVRKDENGNWVPFVGDQVFKATVSTGTLQLPDGTSKEVSIEPMEVDRPLNGEAVIRAVQSGAWTAEDLGMYGLKEAADAVIPEGQRPVGSARFEEQKDGSLLQVYDLEEIPPPPPDPDPPTAQEKLEALGLSLDDLAELINLVNQRTPVEASSLKV